ncbi:MAG: hypothetical protein FJ026_03470 [Chloroflexi bacterium]|nr:hypothetical protein [Chloroflexota bacterium]
MMTHFDLCLAWNWEYDADFVALVQAAAQEQAASLLQIVPDNLGAMCEALDRGEVTFGALLDRACDSDPQFMPIVRWAQRHGARNLNPYANARRAWDKAAMHLEFLSTGLLVPDAIILPAYREQPDIPPVDLTPLGPSFSIKPACGGGGDGVINHAESWEQVLAARQQFPHDKYLLQTLVVPIQHGPHLAWFRIIYCGGEVYPCWWDVHTHVYTPLYPLAENNQVAIELNELAADIAGICGLELFSTEAAFTADRQLIAVDYVNDPIDLRLQSKAADGVPDHIVQALANRLMGLAAHNT